MKFFNTLAFLLLSLLLVSCGGSDSEIKKTPVDKILLQLDKYDDFGVILYDMEIKEGTLSDDYKHRYKITYEKEAPMAEADKEAYIKTKKEELLAEGDTAAANNIVPPKTKTEVKDSLTKWYDVSEAFFGQQSKNMGMEVASKYDGKVSKVAGPPGYKRYVGNQQYGHWQQRSNGTSFWAFYGQYMFMRSMFGYGSPIYRSGYNNYRSSYRSNRPYYGSGSTRYGTGSANARSQNKGLANKSSKFRQKLSRVQRSTSSRTGRSRSSSSRSRSGGSRGGK